MTQTAPHRKFKVCLVSISLAKGGAERSCAMLSQMLAAKGHEVHTVIITDGVDYPYEGALFNLGTLKSSKDNFISRFKRFKKLRSYLKKERFDVVIDHCPKNIYFREYFYDRYVYRGLPRIYVVHTSKEEFALTPQPEKLVKIYNRNVANVAVSKYIEKEILEVNGVGNARTIYNAYNEDWSHDTITEPTVLDDKKYILSYGRLDDSIKDFTFLMNAFSLSKIWKNGFELVIMGDGEDLEKLKTTASSLDCATHIRFLPFQKNPFPYIAKAHFVTLTSRYEGFPMVLLESLSLGTPVVSLDIISGPSEIIKQRENGLLVSERSLPLFAEAMHTMCTDEALYESCKTNTKPSVKQFSMEEISKKWDQLLQDEL